MTKYQNHEMDFPQTQETTQVELLESILTLRALLYRLISLLNSESIETRTRSTLVMEKMQRGIRQILASRLLRNGQDRLECWENEGGRIRYVSE